MSWSPTATFVVRDFRSVDDIPLPRNCQKRKFTTIESIPSMKKPSIESFVKESNISPGMGSLLIPCPKKERVEIWSDIALIWGSMVNVGQRGDENGIDAILSAWFPEGGGEKIGDNHVKEARCIFIDEFCPRLELNSMAKTAVLTRMKMMNVWDCAVSLLVSGSSEHYLKPFLVSSLHNVDNGGISSLVGPIFMLPLMTCLSIAFNMIEEKKSSFEERWGSILDEGIEESVLDKTMDVSFYPIWSALNLQHS
jgi:hypothetical protein